MSRGVILTFPKIRGTKLDAEKKILIISKKYVSINNLYKMRENHRAEGPKRPIKDNKKKGQSWGSGTIIIFISLLWS